MTNSAEFDARPNQTGGGSRVGKVALVGFGTVGKSIAKILCARANGDFRLTHVCNRNIARIRQISRAELKDDTLFGAVQPSLVQLSSPLARVERSQNLVMATGTYGGETVFGGHGAGGHPTAVAVVSDILAIVQAKQSQPGGAGETVETAQPAEKSPTVTADFATRHYLRFLVKDRPGIIASLATILSKSGINIDSLLQKPGCSKSLLPFLITLEECKASLVDQALKQINALDFMEQPCLPMPIL